MFNIDQLIAKAKESQGRSVGALINGLFFRAWTDKQGKVRLETESEKISLKNARAAIAKATEAK
jgi:hypothetical protein